MQLKYVDTKEEIIAVNKKSKHIEPHLHNALEIVCVTSGTLELGVGQELYHMEKGDIGFVFPDIIHHYQVLTPGVNKATYLIASPFTIGKFADIRYYSRTGLSSNCVGTLHRKTESGREEPCGEQ